MTATLPPASASSLSSGARSAASGVVRLARSLRVGNVYASVPNPAAVSPAFAAIRPIRSTTVLLPFVPVTPTIRMPRSGCPARAHAASAVARRGRAAWSQETPGPGSRSERTAAAPFATARSTKSIPCLRCPGSAAKTNPGLTRLRHVRDAGSVGIGAAQRSPAGCGEPGELHVRTPLVGCRPSSITVRVAMRPNAGAATSAAQ